jgi:Mannose-6-phosphate isomerase
VLSFVSGVGEARVGGQKRKVEPGDLVSVPAGTKHNFVNTGPNPLVLYTVYGPPSTPTGPSTTPRRRRTRPRSPAGTSHRADRIFLDRYMRLRACSAA